MRMLSLALALGLAALPAAAEPVDPKVYQDAQQNPARFPNDAARDAARKPAELMAFFGFRPGMSVLDVMSGGGFTTEYLSWLVGPQGHVTAYNPPAFESFVKDEVAARFGTGRLKNVERVVLPFAEFVPRAGAYDAVIIVQDYHDVYWVKEPVWPKVDGPRLLAAIWTALKDDGFVAIVDHHAVAGSGTSAAQTLHRIERSAVIKDFEAAGFRLAGESELLRNPADDRSRNVFDDAIRGRTDQFVLRFVKLGKRQG